MRRPRRRARRGAGQCPRGCGAALLSTVTGACSAAADRSLDGAPLIKGASVEGALDLLEVLMGSRLLARAERIGREE